MAFYEKAVKPATETGSPKTWGVPSFDRSSSVQVSKTVAGIAGI